MEGFIKFLADNYLIFLLIALVLVFALIGYLVDSRKKDKVIKEDKEPENAQVEEVKSVVNVHIGDAKSTAFKEVIPVEEALENEEIETIEDLEEP